MGNSCCFFCGCIDQASVGVIEKWGRFYKLAHPGLHLFNPFAGEMLSGVLSTRIASLDVKIETKTKFLTKGFFTEESIRIDDAAGSSGITN